MEEPENMEALRRHLVQAQGDALEAALNGRPVEESLAILGQAACALGEGVRTAFYLADRTGAKLKHVVGMPADYAAEVDGASPGPESLACSPVNPPGEPVLAPDVMDDPIWGPWRELARRFGYRGCWTFPIRSRKGRLVGAFAIYWPSPRAAQSSEIEMAALVTRTAAIIIAHQIEADRRHAAETALRDSEEQVRAALRRQNVLLAELQHRVRNIMAMIRSITRQTARTTESSEEMGQLLEGRINALARTQAQLTRQAGAGLSLETMLREELLAQAAEEDRVEVEGPPVELAPKAAEVLTLALHELATNSTKYGALGQRGGLKVAWRIIGQDGEDRLELIWRESGVRIMTSGARRSGFGTELIEERVPYELSGQGELAFRPGGVEAKISFPLVQGESVLHYSPGPGQSEGE